MVWRERRRERAEWERSEDGRGRVRRRREGGCGGGEMAEWERREEGRGSDRGGELFSRCSGRSYENIR